MAAKVLVLCNNLAGVFVDDVKAAIEDAQEGIAYISLRGNIPLDQSIRLIPLEEGMELVDIPVIILRQKAEEK